MKHNLAVICLALVLGFVAGHISSPLPVKAGAGAKVLWVNPDHLTPGSVPGTALGISCISASSRSEEGCYVLVQ